MSASAVMPAAERDTRAKAAEGSAVRVAQRRVMNPMLLVGGAYWVLYALVVTAIIVGNDLAGNGLSRSILDFQWGGSSRWMVFVLGIIIPPALLRPHVAAGGTRRSHAIGTIRAAALIGLAFGVATGLYLAGERALFGAFGMPWGYDTGLPADGFGGLALRGLAEALVIATYTLSGALLSMGYYRFGAGRGTAFIPVALVPPSLADLFTRTGGLAALVGDRYPLDGVAAVAAGLAGGVLSAALAAWLLHKVSRGIQLHPPV